ncbi:MAG: magnesium transporter [Cytophagales bacterium]|nr:MAG: magnesium transporter [Cytophagales bacterium]
MQNFEITAEFIQRLEQAVKVKEDSFIVNCLDDFYAADISTILYEMSTADCQYIIRLLATDTAAEIISNLDSNTRTEFLKNFKAEEIAIWVEQLDSDDAVDILNELSLKKREEVLACLEDKEFVQAIIDLLHYDEESAGGLMAKELIKANLNWTVVQCIDEIRRQAEKVEKFYSVYVIDDQNKILGRVSLKKIILSPNETLIADIYEQEIISVPTYMEQEEVAELMQRYDLEAVPVVNVRGELVGRITIDDIVDVITEQADLDRQMMAGLTEDTEESDSILTLSRARLPWLIIGMVGGLLGARFIGFFEQDLILVPAMAFFIPLITATGGNVGIQSSSLVLQSLSNKAFHNTSYLSRIFKVFWVALLNGFVMATCVFTISIFVEENWRLSLVVSIALLFVVLLASLMGTITPILLDRLRINPALASGPFITTANDLLGLAVYFTTAHFLYH